MKPIQSDMLTELKVQLPKLTEERKEMLCRMGFLEKENENNFKYLEEMILEYLSGSMLIQKR